MAKGFFKHPEFIIVGGSDGKIYKVNRDGSTERIR